MPYDSSSADELLETIYGLVERLIDSGPEETRHDRANLGNEIVLCAAVLRQRLARAEQKRSSEQGLEREKSR